MMAFGCNPTSISACFTPLCRSITLTEPEDVAPVFGSMYTLAYGMPAVSLEASVGTGPAQLVTYALDDVSAKPKGAIPVAAVHITFLSRSLIFVNWLLPFNTT